MGFWSEVWQFRDAAGLNPFQELSHRQFLLRKGEDVSTFTEGDLCNAEDMVKVMAPVQVMTTVMCED